MTQASTKALSDRDLEEVWSRGDASMLDELYAPDLVDHNPTPGLPPGREGLKHFHAALHAAFVEVSFTVDVVVANDDIVARRWTMRGIHRAPFLGIPPRGGPVSMTGIDVLRVVGGRFSEIWHSEDLAGLLEQLGVPPPAGAAP